MNGKTPLVHRPGNRRRADRRGTGRKRELFNELIAQNGLPSQLGLAEGESFGLFDLQGRPKRAAA